MASKNTQENLDFETNKKIKELEMEKEWNITDKLRIITDKFPPTVTLPISYDVNGNMKKE